jgi:diacylglycerol kinase (ATP)
MPKPGHRGLTRVVMATLYSARGFNAAWRNEAAFRQELGLTLLLVPAALWLGRSPVEQALLIGACLLVLITELLNSAIEAVVDRVGDETNRLSGRAKDMGSAAVFTSLCLVVLLWGAVMLDRFG